MLRAFAVIVMVLAATPAATPARADTGPVLVIPSRPGVPVIINGWDASYAVVEGDWGLARPGHGVVTVLGGTPVMPSPVYHPRNSYYPRHGRPPARGGFAIEPPTDRQLPPPAEPSSRYWSTSSDVPPLVIDAPGPNPALPLTDDVSPTIVDPKTFQQPLIIGPLPR